MARNTKLRQINRINTTVTVLPEIISKGEMLQVAVAITNDRGFNVIVPRIYLEILDSVGRIAFPLTAIAQDASGFVRLISTSELKTNTRYTIRAAINTKMIRHGIAYFKTEKSLPVTPFLLLPIIPILQQQLIQESPGDPNNPNGPNSNIDSTAPLIPKVLPRVFLIYRTELDTRVCQICAAHEGKIFDPHDQNIIRIGPPELGGETHWRCRCNYEVLGTVNIAVIKAKQKRDIILSVIKVKNHKEKQR